MRLENVDIKLMRVRPEVRSDGFVCAVRDDAHPVKCFPKPLVARCRSVARDPAGQVAGDGVRFLLALDGVGGNRLPMLCVVSPVEDAIDDRAAGTIPFDGSDPLAVQDPGKLRGYTGKDIDDSVVCEFPFKESGDLFHLPSFLPENWLYAGCCWLLVLRLLLAHSRCSLSAFI